MILNKILYMGGYGFYVWTSYGITLAIFSLNFIIYFQEKKRLKNRIFHYWEKQL